MKREHEPRLELRPAISRDMLPASELLQQTQDLAAIWPPEVANNPEFRRQLEERALLRERLDGVQSRLPRPDVSLEDAIGRGIVTEEQVADLYSSLSELLKDGSEYRRLALYLPFEFLPNASATFATDRLNSEAANVQREYMSAWSSLLNVHDVRANFVDGDVLEVDKRDGGLPRADQAHVFAITPGGNAVYPGSPFFELSPTSERFAVAPVDSILTPLDAGWALKGEEKRSTPYRIHIAYMESLYQRVAAGAKKVTIVGNGGLYSIMEVNEAVSRGFTFLFVRDSGRFAEAAAALLPQIDQLSMENDAELWEQCMNAFRSKLSPPVLEEFLRKDFGPDAASPSADQRVYRDYFREFLRLARKHKEKITLSTVANLESDLRRSLEKDDVKRP